ncbi:zinc ABC transporter substrate-binding protein [Methanolobus sp. ZRKC3]|uniref:metal ABC transporter solute-binding protein, Zn/Mn family n=1 Tax=Methanolobus sp. ZRKC3 TaxID=3125786 RepID=UPI003253551E
MESINKLTLLILSFFLLSAVLVSGCVDTQENDSLSGKMVVAVSIVPQAEFVEKIAGDLVSTVVMIPPGASPATHEPTPGQLRELSKADLYVKVGSGVGFETAWMDDLVSVNPDMLIIDSSAGIELRSMVTHGHEEENAEGEYGHEDEQEGMDPHIWTSPQKAKIMVMNIHAGLVQTDPENEELYTMNRDAYIAELDQVDEKIRSALVGREGSSFMVYHPSWGYFADEYGLEQIPVEIEGKEPSVQDLQRLIDTANEKKIKVIFVQSGFSTSSARAIAAEIGGEVVEVDPLTKDYIDNLSKVSEAFEKGLA